MHDEEQDLRRTEEYRDRISKYDPNSDYYGILGVSSSATQDEIKRVYRDLAKANHPDSADPSKEKNFKEVNNANEVLSDPKNRKKYDENKEKYEQEQAKLKKTSKCERVEDLYESGDLAGAVREAESLFGNYPDDTDLQNQYALLLYEWAKYLAGNGKLKEAATQLRKAAENILDDELKSRIRADLELLRTKSDSATRPKSDPPHTTKASSHKAYSPPPTPVPTPPNKFEGMKVAMALIILWFIASKFPSCQPTKTTLTFTPSPTNTPPPEKPPESRSAASGKVINSESSPLLDIRVEVREGAESSREIWFVARNDITQQRLFFAHHRSAWVLFSPDQRYVILNNFPSSSGGGAELYVSQGNFGIDKLAYVRAKGMEDGKPQLEDLAWGYYLKTTGRNESSDRNHILIPAIAWEPHSDEVVLRISCSGSNTDNSVPENWYCRYNARDGNFTAISPANSYTFVRKDTMMLYPVVSSYTKDEQEVVQFIGAQLERGNSHNVELITEHYEEKVNFRKKGEIGKVAIWQILREYYKLWPRGREDLTSRIDLETVVPNMRWIAKFSTKFRLESIAQKEWAEGEQRIVMGLVKVNGELRIISDSAELLYHQRGALSSATPIPSIAPQALGLIRLRVSGVISGDTLNLRAEPDGSSRIVAEVPAKTTGIIQTGEGIHNGNDLWLPVQVGTLAGFIHGNFLVPEAEGNKLKAPPIVATPNPKLAEIPPIKWDKPLATPPPAPAGKDTTCAKCGKSFHVLPEHLHTSFNCPHCGESLHVNTPPAIQSENLTGERYPQTRLRSLRAEELHDWSAEKLRYAINEMYARHGADFGDRDVLRAFSGFSWYHPRKGSTYEQAELLFTPLETENLKLLGQARDARKKGFTLAVAPTPGPNRYGVSPPLSWGPQAPQPPSSIPTINLAKVGNPKSSRIGIPPKQWSAEVNVPNGYRVKVTSGLKRIKVLLNGKEERTLYRNPVVTADRSEPGSISFGFNPLAGLSNAPRTHEFGTGVRTLRLKSLESEAGSGTVEFVPAQ